MISIECGRCKTRNAKTHEVCRGCNTKLPKTGRVYWISWRDSLGKQRSERLGLVSMQSAKVAEMERMRDASEGRLHPVKKAPTLINIYSAYVRKFEAENKHPFLIADAKRIIGHACDIWGRDCLVTSITVADINSYVNELLSRGLSKSSVNRRIAFLRAAINYGAPDCQNPFRGYKKFKTNNLVANLLNITQERALLEFLAENYNWFYQVVVCAINTGLRKQNVLQLRRDQVDFERRTFTLIQKGGRILTRPINSATYDVLASIPDNGTGYFWVNPITQKPYVDVKRIWKSVKQSVGIPGVVRFHDLRHLMVSKVLAATSNVKIAQELVGHSDIATTMRYAHLAPGVLEDSIEKICAQ